MREFSYFGQCIGESFNQRADGDQVARENIDMVAVASVIGNVRTLYSNIANCCVNVGKNLYEYKLSVWVANTSVVYSHLQQAILRPLQE